VDAVPLECTTVHHPGKGSVIAAIPCAERRHGTCTFVDVWWAANPPQVKATTAVVKKSAFADRQFSGAFASVAGALDEAQWPTHNYFIGSHSD
jgi:hypothetical protein